VVAGEGTSTIGDETIHWTENDTFTAPHWSRATHEATSAAANLFIVTDKEVQVRLEVAREETH
jgi:gentisate 1,2-dioxygenase